MKHCDSLMPDYQSAYRKFYSCETVLVKLVNDILWAMEHQKILSLVCIDLSAAFDTVDHEILDQVLKMSMGLMEQCCSGIKHISDPEASR